MEAESTEDAELYQVANYGLAGQYDVHYDQIMMTNDPASRMQKREVFNAKMVFLKLLISDPMVYFLYKYDNLGIKDN